jgi:hypothetical protein
MTKRRRAGRDWRAIVQGQATSGKSISAYCRQQGVSPSHFYRKKREYGSEAAASHEGGVVGGFVELTPVDRPSPCSGVAVVTKHGWRLEVEPGFDAATLERVLACVRQAGPCSH